MAFYMKRKIMNPRMVKIMNEEEVRVIGYCVECGDEITDDIGEYYCAPDGSLLCSKECIIEHFNIAVMED